MPEKKELNKEELEKVSGGDEETLDGYKWCNTCNNFTKPKEVTRIEGDMFFTEKVCSICNNQY